MRKEMDELSSLAECLVRASVGKPYLVCGVILCSDPEIVKDPGVHIVNFGNLTERGPALAHFYRRIAELIERKYAEGSVENAKISQVI